MFDTVYESLLILYFLRYKKNVVAELIGKLQISNFHVLPTVDTGV